MQVRLYFCTGCFILSLALVLGASLAFAAQELKVGFIGGRGDDAAVEGDAFSNAAIEYEVIGEGDFNLDNLLKFDVIGVGVVAYDQNEGLKANFEAVNEYVEKGGYLVILDFQQDSTWDESFLPHPLTLFDDDLEEDAGVEIIDHPIWNTPYEITEDHFVGWGAGDFMADGPHEADPPWQPLIISSNWPVVVGAEAGEGYVVFNSLQVLQALGRTGNEKVAEVLHNLLFWRGPLATCVHANDKLTATWGTIKAQCPIVH